MSRFQFPYSIDLSDTKPIILKRTKEQKFSCDGINILEYLTEDEVNNADNIVVFGSRLTWFKGVETITSDMVWDSVNFKIEEHPEREITGKNLYVTWLPTPMWSFSELISDYHREKEQHYIKVSLEECVSEMDVLGFASGLTHLYGYHFTVHTVSDKQGVYHITVSGKYDIDVSIFNEIATHQEEVHINKGLWIECKVRKSEGKEENKMPIAPNQGDWDW